MNWLPQTSLSFQVHYDTVAVASSAVVAAVALIVGFYAIGYLRHQGRPEYARFFALYEAFVFAMFGFVASNSLLLSYVCWEAMTACSYLLISFKKSEGDAKAGTRAMTMTRIGDLALLLGLALMWRSHGTVNVAVIAHSDPNAAALALIAVGALAKSAAIPFSPWLVGAMRAPTPVSALLHSATLVAAGPYLLLRLDPAIAHAPQIAQGLMILAIATAFTAALLATMSTDAKRVLAYSTIEQLAQATLAAALNVPIARLIFLAAHAASKPALFFAAGEVQIATGSTGFQSASRIARAVPSIVAAVAYGTLMLIGTPPSFSLAPSSRIWSALPLAAPVSFLLEGLLAVLLGVYLARFTILLFPAQARPFDRAALGRVMPAASFLGITIGLTAMAYFYRWPAAADAAVLPVCALLGGGLVWFGNSLDSTRLGAPLLPGLPSIDTLDRAFANATRTLASLVSRVDSGAQTAQERFASCIFRLGKSLGAVDDASEYATSIVSANVLRRAGLQLGALINGDVSRYLAYCVIWVTAAACGAALLLALGALLR